MLFLILTIVGARKMIVRAVPEAIHIAIPAGIGLFIAFVGLQNAGIVALDTSTKVTLISFNLIKLFDGTGTVAGAAMIKAAMAIVSLLIIAILSKLKVKGAMVFGIIGSALLYYAFIGIGYAAGSAACKAVFDEITFSNPIQAFQDFGTQAFGKAFT